MRIASLMSVAVAVVLTGCGQPLRYEYKTLGTVGITAHKILHVGLLRRQLCQFRVKFAGYALGYAGSSRLHEQHSKCLTMKNGDQITVIQRTLISGNDKRPAVRYIGKVGEVEFILR